MVKRTISLGDRGRLSNRIREKRAQKTRHRTRWPGHCAGTEATPQPRSPAVPSPLVRSTRSLRLASFANVLRFSPSLSASPSPSPALNSSRSSHPLRVYLSSVAQPSPPPSVLSLFGSLPTPRDSRSSPSPSLYPPSSPDAVSISVSPAAASLSLSRCFFLDRNRCPCFRTKSAPLLRSTSS